MFAGMANDAAYDVCNFKIKLIDVTRFCDYLLHCKSRNCSDPAC